MTISPYIRYELSWIVLFAKEEDRVPNHLRKESKRFVLPTNETEKVAQRTSTSHDVRASSGKVWVEMQNRLYHRRDWILWILRGVWIAKVPPVVFRQALEIMERGPLRRLA